MRSEQSGFAKKSSWLAVFLIGAFAVYSQSLPDSKSEHSACWHVVSHVHIAAESIPRKNDPFHHFESSSNET